jgi:hypothetical protein
MLFTRRLREGIRRGRIRCTIRIWQQPRVKAGGFLVRFHYLPPGGWDTAITRKTR